MGVDVVKPDKLVITCKLYLMAERRILAFAQCCQSSGICGEQYVSDVSFETDEPDSPIKASRLRMQLQVGAAKNWKE